MSSHELTVAVYALIGLAAAGLQALSTRGGSRIPSLGATLDVVMQTRSGRVGLVAGWAWLGLHFFAR